MKPVYTVVTSLVALTAASSAAFAGTAIGLVGDNTLVMIDAAKGTVGKSMTVKGVDRLLGIDMRPADKKLYGKLNRVAVGGPTPGDAEVAVAGVVPSIVPNQPPHPLTNQPTNQPATQYHLANHPPTNQPSQQPLCCWILFVALGSDLMQL